jgi:hypothetical protein
MNAMIHNDEKKEETILKKAIDEKEAYRERKRDCWFARKR